MREAFAKFRVVFWALAGGLLSLYFFGLLQGAYGPLELGLLSVVCLVVLVLFVIHEVRLRRELRAHPGDTDHSDRERRGF